MVYGDGTATKDYVFVEDFCKGLFELIEKEVWSQVINFGSGYLYSVNEILAEIKKYIRILFGNINQRIKMMFLIWPWI